MNSKDLEAFEQREAELKDTVSKLSELICKQGEVLAMHDEAFRLCTESLKKLTERVAALEECMDKNGIAYHVSNLNYKDCLKIFSE